MKNDPQGGHCFDRLVYAVIDFIGPDVEMKKACQNMTSLFTAHGIGFRVLLSGLVISLKRYFTPYILGDRRSFAQFLTFLASLLAARTAYFAFSFRHVVLFNSHHGSRGLRLNIILIDKIWLLKLLVGQI